MKSEKYNPGRVSLAMVVMVPIALLIPSPRNPRTHSKRQIQKIAHSIDQFGFVNPVLVQPNLQILAGHGRVAAAKLLGWAEVPTLEVANLTPAQLRAYLIADNRLAEEAGWDPELLAIEFEELRALDLEFDLEVTGFEHAAIDLMIQERTREPDPEDDFVVEVVDCKAITEPGDIWNLDSHRIICGNALDPDIYSRLLVDEKAQMAFCDPPYNVKIDGHVSGLGAVRHREFAMASGEMTKKQFAEFLGLAASHLKRFSIDGSLHYVCMDWRHLQELLDGASAHFSNVVNMCVWDKGQGGMGSLYRSQHELIVVFKAGQAPHINNVALGKHGRNRTNVWRYPGANAMSRGRQAKLALHPTVKPVALVADAILDASQRDGIILDAFGGSGTTILAAERTGRQARLIEIDPAYVDVTIERWQRMTKNEAFNLRTGLTYAAMCDLRAEK